jgi:hypothetical protein
MSEQPKDGGTAFPAPNYVVPSDLAEKDIHRIGETQGMSLRDWLAGNAPDLPPQLIARWWEVVTANDPTFWELPWHEAALRQYATLQQRWRGVYADTMLVERASTPQEPNDEQPAD